MQPPNQHHRINLVKLKAQLVKNLGEERSKRYFYYLNRFLNLKVCKVEFNKHCLQVVGRENILLHNHFIRSILKNASSAKPAPPTLDKQNVSTPPVLLNGEIRARSKLKFRIETLDQEQAEQAKETEQQVSHYPSVNFSLTKRFPDGSVSLPRKGTSEDLLWEDKKEVFSRNLLRGPLGLPSCQVSAHKRTPLASSSSCASSFNSGGLLDTPTLRQKMEHISAVQGLEGVTMDCANILNKGLDVYLKRLVASCVELVRARSGREFSSTNKNQSHSKLVNGVRPGHHLHMQTSSNRMESIRQRKIDCPISLPDFRVAMDVNPRQLGEDWPILLEKICTNAFEE